VFFFNPSTKSSVWERPAELKGRPDVDKLLKCPPDANDSGKQQTKNQPQTEGNVTSESGAVSCDSKAEKRPSSDELENDKKKRYVSHCNDHLIQIFSLLLKQERI